MSPLRNFGVGLKALFRKQKNREELDEELQGFLEAAVESKIRAGMSHEEALRAARMEMGSTAAVQDRVHESSWESSIQSMWQDVRYGARTLRSSPGFTFVAVITLALGIGINAGIFTILNAVSFRLLPVKRPAELASIYQSFRGHLHRSVHGSPTMSSYPEYQDFRDGSRSFSGLMAYAPFVSATINNGKPREILGTLVSCNYFDVLEVRPALGRAFTKSECDVPGSAAVAILSDALWRSDFGSDPDLVGKVVSLNRVPFTVIGVAPQGFGGTELAPSAFWVPLTMQGKLTHEDDFVADANTGWLMIAGRLKPGVTLSQARADLRLITAKFDQLQPGKITTVSVVPTTLTSDPEMHTIALAVGTAILFAVGLVLLIACANIANLQLARGASRGREIAVRLALGARRSRIIRQLLTESLLLALVGGFLGTLTAFWVPAAIVHYLLSHLPSGSWDFALDARPDLRVLLYALVLTLVTGIAFGLVPALRSSRPDLMLAMRQESTENQRRRPAFLRNSLVGVQVAVCMVLLTTAALLLKGLYRAQTVDPGFAMKDTTVISIDLGRAGYDQNRATVFQGKLRDRLTALPGVDAVAQSLVTPLDNRHDITELTVSETQQEYEIEFNRVAPGYFSILAIPIVRGRNFSDAEERANAQVVIVTESAARRFWPGKDPIGKTLRDGARKIFEVIGVAADAQVAHLGKSDTTYVYWPVNPDSQLQLRTMVHSTAGYAATEKAIQRMTDELDPELPVIVSRLEDNLEFWRAPAQIVSVLSGGLSGFALLLAAFGIYGMVSYGVSRKVREIAIRVALGANRGRVMSLILRRAMRPVILGAVIGVAACIAVSSLLSALLYGVSPYDPLALIGVVVFFLLVALLAGYVPARHVTHVDPTVALRHE
jgi:predicted permease